MKANGRLLVSTPDIDVSLGKFVFVQSKANEMFILKLF